LSYGDVQFLKEPIIRSVDVVQRRLYRQEGFATHRAGQGACGSFTNLQQNVINGFYECTGCHVYISPSQQQLATLLLLSYNA